MIQEAKCRTCAWWKPDEHGEHGRCEVGLPPMAVLGSDVQFCRAPAHREYSCGLWRSAQGGKL